MQSSEGLVMSTKLKFDTKNRILFMKRYGSIQPGELADEIQKVVSHSDYNSVDRIISDLTESDFTTVSTAEMNKFAEFCRNKFNDISAIALIAPKDLSFGISRMFVILSSLENVEVFREKKDALDCLGIHDLPDEIM